MHTPSTRLSLGLNALALAACSASSTPNTIATDGGARTSDAADAASADPASPDAASPDAASPDAGQAEPVFECDAGPDEAGSDAIFFRAKRACEQAMPSFFGECGMFYLSFDDAGRAKELTRGETFGPLPEGYATCILNELANETYDCLAGSVVESYESCTLP